jgi:chemotaxis protein methyltransferase CheR
MVHLTHQESARLRSLITSYSALRASLLTDEALERAVDQRLVSHGLDRMAEYWPLVQRRRTGEMDILVQLLSHKETFFFQEMHHFEVLRDRILPELLTARKFSARPDYLQAPSNPVDRQPLRLWSAGCFTGEEAYSLAIILLEYGQLHADLDAEVIATDVDARAIEVARQGQYSERAIRLVPDRLLQRYFTFDDQTFHVIPEVARLVRFQVHSLAEERCPSELSGLDVIFCRNVTIYLDPGARDRLNARLADCLREGGYLFVASAETMGHNRGRLDLFAVGNTFLFRKRSAAGTLAPSSTPTSPPARQPGPSLTPKRAAWPTPSPQQVGPAQFQAGLAIPSAQDALLYRAYRAFRHRQYDAALGELDQTSADQPVVLEVYSLRAAVLVQQGHLAEAESVCQYLLAHDPWYVDAHFLMGLVALHQHQADAAIQSLKTATYLQPEHRWAHFYLAEAYRAAGLRDKALREYKSTLSIIRAAQQSLPVPDLNLTSLDDEALRLACETHLEKPQARPVESGSKRT